MKFYHVDRQKTLHRNLLIDKLNTLESLNTEWYKANVLIADWSKELYPDGLSKHGCSYLFGENEMIPLSLELSFEMIRQKYFHNKPSRFQSFFAFKNKEDTSYFGQGYPLFEVECSDYFVGDMNLLHYFKCFTDVVTYAMAYWQGDSIESLVPGNSSCWEVLIKPPFKIL